MSAQQVDPLSWFTGSLVALAFAILILIYGAVLTVVTWNVGSLPWLQLVAVALSVASPLVVHVATRPLRRGIGWGIGALAVGLSASGMIVSAIGYASSPFAVELWWAPGAMTLAIASLGAYLPARKLIVLGVAATLVAVPIVLAIIHPTSDTWGALETAVIVAYPLLLGVAATATFAHAVVSTMLPMLESPSRILVAGQTVKDEVAESIERVTVARLTARAAPFLEKIAAAGRITPLDRAFAGQLARRLRDELVTQSNLSWLDSIASESRLVVVDPDRRAQRMNNAQRTALRALLRAVLDTPGTDTGSLMVELRPADDGATAVGVSLDIALPEGRRIMHLAPYYLTLKTAVDDLSVIDGRLLSFRIPGEKGA
ncbi:hypothetical protein BH10ACT7_BH10ACT7_15380 [soil metagenome]